MRTVRDITLILILAAILPAVAVALENRNVRSPIGRGNVPQSSGLIRSPNPLDASGYSSTGVVTGTVGGGRHFRGVVPYSSFNYFSSVTGSESTESFLRYSGSGSPYETYTGGTAPYYSQSRIVTTTTPQGSVVGPVNIYRSYRPEAAGQRPALQPAAPSIRQESTYPPGLRPMSMSLEEMERLISSQGEITGREKEQLQQYRQAQEQQLEQELEQAGDKAAELERKLTYKKPVPQQQKYEQPVIPQPAEEKEPSAILRQQPAAPIQKLPDVYEQMKQQIEAIKKELESGQIKKPAEKPEKAEEKPDASKKNALEGLSREEISYKAETVRSKYKSFAAYSQDKFNKFMLAGENYLKEGKYYLAADAYTLANVYKANDPLSYAGKSYALFAAGEYMSSALYLSKALMIFPEYAQFKIDLVAMVGDKDKLENRILDVKEWLTRSDAAELHFLLAYVYYQMDNMEEARKSIDTAYGQMPDAPAVKTLKDAIYGTAK